MKSPAILFMLKCSIIIYCTAFIDTSKFTTANTTSNYITKGSWKIEVISNSANYPSINFNAFTFTFNNNGVVTVKKDDFVAQGSWLEHDITKQININFGNQHPALADLNNLWQVANITKTHIKFINQNKVSKKQLFFTASL
jgi:hypothetical protein